MALTKLRSKNKAQIKPSINIKSENSPLFETDEFLARKILLKVMRYRRIASSKTSCRHVVCEACLAPHLSQVLNAVTAYQPIRFVLPAFPAKSPNPAKVLGTLPDMAEMLSLKFLHELCLKIQKIYPPGAQVILCSDGRVFNDVIGIRDADVSDYQQALEQQIKEASLSAIRVVNLNNFYANHSFVEMRNQLMKQYGEPVESLREIVRLGARSGCNMMQEETHRHYCGMTRFLVEDAMRPGLAVSRNTIQNECRQRAYVLIQRSRAWGALIADHYPDAVRLSIHPQSCGSHKLGIRLLEAENWMTPWHGVAVDVGDRFVLLKRSQAESLSGVLIYRDGRPSHYKLTVPGNSELRRMLDEI